MKLWLLLLFLTCASLAHAQQYAIIEARAVGSKRFAEADILKTTGIEKGRKDVTLERVKDAAAKLLGLGVFKEVGYKHVAAPGGIKVEFTVKDSDEFVRADFENIVWLPPAEIVKELHARVPLFSGELPVNMVGSIADDVAAALQSLLNERGVACTISAAPWGPREGMTESYIYTAEGVEVTIGQINFAGTSTTFSPLLEAAARPLLGTHYQRSTLAKFVENNLLNVYRKRGFLRARFATPEVAVAAHKEASTSVAVTLPVEEGREYTFGGIAWSGNTARSTDELNQGIHLHGVTDGVQLDSDITALRTAYAQLGYMHMFLDLKATYDGDAGVVRYEANLHEGELFRMGKLDIAGLQPSSAEKVRQRWRMREGDPYDDAYVRKFFSQFRLPPGVAYVVEQSEGEAKNSIDLTLIFCKEGTRCMASGPNQLYIPVEEERRR